MKKLYVTDSQAVIALQGLRWAKKEEWSNPDKKYSIEVAYKHQTHRIYYPTQEERDRTFTEIVKALELKP